MIKAQHHRFLYAAFRVVTRFLIRRNFKAVHLSGNFVDNGQSIWVIANHVSWWDGFWVMWLNLQVLHRKFHFMALEEQVKKHWTFRYVGGYSVKKQSRSILESLDYSSHLLKQADNMVLMFPQGKIHSLYHPTVSFEKGIERILDTIAPDTQIVMVVNLIDYLSDSKPTLYTYFHQLEAKDCARSGLESEYQKLFEQALHTQQTKST